MRKLIGIVAALGLSTAAMAAGPGPTEPSYIYHATVVKVVDGDTVDLDIDLGFFVLMKAQRIELLGIDAPEASGQTKPEGDKATSFLEGLIGGKSVIVRTVRGRDDDDREGSFGRWLGIIYLDGVDINETMIATGHAAKYER